MRSIETTVNYATLLYLGRRRAVRHLDLTDSRADGIKDSVVDYNDRTSRNLVVCGKSLTKWGHDEMPQNRRVPSIRLLFHRPPSLGREGSPGISCRLLPRPVIRPYHRISYGNRSLLALLVLLPGVCGKASSWALQYHPAPININFICGGLSHCGRSSNCAAHPGGSGIGAVMALEVGRSDGGGSDRIAAYSASGTDLPIVASCSRELTKVTA